MPEDEQLSARSHDENVDNLDELFGDESEEEMVKMDVDSKANTQEPAGLTVDVEMKFAEASGDDDDDDEEVVQNRNKLNFDIFGDDDTELSSENNQEESDVAAGKITETVNSKTKKSKNVLAKKPITLGPTTSFTDSKLKPYLLKLPGFIAVEEEEYSRETLDNEELALLEVDEAGNYPKDGLLRLASSIRWRVNPMTDKLESNARLVRWSDGSLSLNIGSEQFEVMTQNTQKENCYLYSRHAKEGCMEAIGKLPERLAVRPFVTADQSHRKYLAISTAAVQSVAHPSGREAAKVKMAVTTADPEREKQRMIKIEQEKIKSKRKVEARRRNLQTRSYERVAQTGLSARFLEEEEGDEAGEDLDQYEDDFIDDEDNAPASASDESSEDTDYKTGASEDGSGSEGEASDSDEESTAQESTESEESDSSEQRRKSKKISTAKKDPSPRKMAKVIESDDE